MSPADPAASATPSAATGATFGPLDAIRMLLRYVRPWRGLTVILVATVIVRVSADLVQRMALKNLIESGLEPRNRGIATAVVIVIGCAVLLSTAAHLYRDVLQARLAALLTNDLRKRYFLHLQQLSSGYFAHTRVNDLMGRFNGDIVAIETAFAALMTGAAAAISIVLAVVSLVLLEPELALVCAVAVPFMILGPRLLAPRAVAAGHEVKRGLRNISNSVHQSLQAQNVVRAYELEGVSQSEFRALQAKVRPLIVRFNVLNALAERTPAIALQLATVAVVAVGSWMVFGNMLSVGALVAYYAVVQSLNASVRELGSTVPVLIRTSVSVWRVQEILTLPVDVMEASGAFPLPPLTKAIAFRGVLFGYEKNRIVLQIPELTIPAGGTVAFVGASGSGKSTALHLLIRFYDPVKGVVTFDGHDLRHASKRSLYDQTAIVFQEGFLFDTTIRDNIRVGRQHATDAEIEQAARNAEVHDAILAMPLGYDTPVEQFGKSLSGGERQRIALARALIRDPRVLLLDEATSALDPMAETAVQATLARVAKGRTVVSVTHRLNTAMTADRIIVFEDGQVAEQGSHTELMALEGAYAALWEKQSAVTLSDTGDDGELRPEWLKRIEIFRELDDTLLAEAAAMFVIERVAEDREVITRGDPGERFFIVAHGKVAVFTPSAKGGDTEVARLSDGDFFGEIALVRDVARTATVRTITPCVFATLPRKFFRALLARAPEVQKNLEALVDRRLAADAALLR